MKKQLALAAVLSALLLTACSGGNPSENSQNGIGSEDSTRESEAPESSDETENTASETAESNIPHVSPPLDPKDLEGIADLDNLYGPDGVKVDKSEITNINYGFDDDGNEDKTKWIYASSDHFAYYSEPRGFSYNSADNADLLDRENWSFNVEENPAAEYKRCVVGDKLGDLTVSYVSSMFGTVNADVIFLTSPDTETLGRELGIAEVFFMGSDISFEGSVDMTGYIFICPEDEGYDARGDIFFTPDAESCVLPVVNFSFDPENGIYTRSYMATHDGEFFFISDYPSIYAGNIFQSELDFDDYPIGEPIKVKLTADNISMRSNVNWITQTQFVITDIEKI